MTSPVDPLSNRESTDFFSAVSVVSISTFSLSEVGPDSEVAMMNFSGSRLSHLGRRRRGVANNCETVAATGGSGDESEARFDSEVCTTFPVSNEGIFSTTNTSKRFLDDKGVLVTRRLWQNPVEPDFPPVYLETRWQELHPIWHIYL